MENNNFQTQRCGVTTDVKQLLRLLGPSMYKGNVIDVACKELLQNSFDAVKGMEDGKILIGADHKNNAIFCQDNGIGMSTETVANVYLKIGGTLKDNLDIADRSGGLGLAKVQFFLSAERIVVDTVKDGVHTMLDCTQEELFSGDALVKHESTDAPNGTTVILYYPTEVHQLDGSVSYISVPSYAPSSIQHPLVGYPNIQVDFKFHWLESNRCQMEDRYTGKSIFDFTWGEVVAYYDPNSYNPLRSPQSSIHSAGLYQFHKRFSMGYGLDLRYNVILNVRPKVAAGMAGYPFNNTREGFNVCVGDDIKIISKYLFDIESVLRSEKIRLDYANMASLQYCDVDGKGYERAVLHAQKPVENFSPEFLEKLVEAFATCPTVYEKKEIVEEASTTLAASKAEIAERKSEALKFKNNTTGIYLESNELFSKIASVILDAIDLLPEDYRHAEKTPTLAGIQIDKHLHGCLVHGHMNALFVNPLSCQHVGNGDAWVEHMLLNFLHEVTHIRNEWHDDDFICSMQNLHVGMIANGTCETIRSKFMSIYAQHGTDIVRLSMEFQQSDER